MANKRTITCVTNAGNPKRKQPYDKVDYGTWCDLVLNFKSATKRCYHSNETALLLNYQRRIFIFQYFQYFQYFFFHYFLFS